jgi:CRP-like cAMP-binding protein
MVESLACRPCPEARVAFRRGGRAVSAHPTPKQNHLLAALPVADYEHLLPHSFESVPLPLGWTVHGAGDREGYLYFVTARLVSRFCAMQGGASKEFAVTGSEGVIGIASFLGGESTPSRAVVLSPGHAFRLGTDLLSREFERDGPMPRLLLRYIESLIAQIGQIAACTRHHLLEQRLCRWILSCVDRLPSSELPATQGTIVQMLGVRREGVTEAAGRLQRAGLIHYHRGCLAVLDRAGLEARSCECYAVLRRSHHESLHPVGSRDDAGVRRAGHPQHAGYAEPARAELAWRQA